MLLIPFLHQSPWQRSQWTVIGQDWFQEFVKSNLLKRESADVKMSYKFLSAVLKKEEKFHIPEKDINFTGKKEKSMELEWGSSQDEYSYSLKAAKMP